MKIYRVVLLCICIIALTTPAWSQPLRPGGPGLAVPGFLNPRTGAFTPMHVRAQENPETATGGSVQPEQVPTPSKVTGTLKVSFSIAVKSSIPTTSSIVCEVDVVAEDCDPTGANGCPNSPEEEANTLATRSSKTAASCTVTIPYSWLLSYRPDDWMYVYYVISVAGTGNPGRSTSQYIAQSGNGIPVPANGTTTSEPVSATM
ncbi:MAG: hypothetical protein WA005_05080 [Candidatus Binataceae bacterium]